MQRRANFSAKIAKLRWKPQAWLRSRPKPLREGVTTVSSAVLDALNKPLVAISAVGFGGQMSETRIKALGEDLRERAGRICSAMAGQRGSGS
jgi:hypothetical protein